MNRKQLIQNSLQEISASRVHAQNVAVSNIMKARQIPEFVNLEKQERVLTFEIGKLNANGSDVSEQEKSLKLVKEQIEHILLKNKIDPNSLVPNYSCKECNDTGYVNGSYCKCLQNKVREKIIQECGIAKRQLSSFNEFKPDIATDEKQNAILKKLKIKLENIAETYPDIENNYIIISGQTGVGKTFLAECLASRLIDRGFIVSFISSSGLNEVFLSYHTSHEEQKQSYLNALIDPDVLIIDDLGTEPLLKNVTLEYLYVVLSERSRLGHLTVITTNLDTQDILDRYNERIFSRLLNKRESFAVHIEGKDLRLYGKK